MGQQAAANITKGLHAFIDNIIDYAGLFPPANLDLKSVVDNYVKYMQEENSFILGKLICPINMLEAMGECLKGHKLNNPIQVIGLVNQPNSSKNVEEAIDSFRKKYHKLAEISSLEVKFFADDTLSETTTLNSMLPTFVEVKDLNQVDEIRKSGAGIKVRCGGVTPNDFPSSSSVASIILRCVDTETPLKFTAGLHHPIRHYSQEYACKMHGFVNIFGGTILAYKQKMDLHDLIHILDDEYAPHFTFDDDGFRWKDLSADCKMIESLRINALQGFGSCSFDEPITDIKTLGWMS